MIISPSSRSLWILDGRMLVDGDKPFIYACYETQQEAQRFFPNPRKQRGIKPRYFYEALIAKQQTVAEAVQEIIKRAHTISAGPQSKRTGYDKERWDEGVRDHLEAHFSASLSTAPSQLPETRVLVQSIAEYQRRMAKRTDEMNIFMLIAPNRATYEAIKALEPEAGFVFGITEKREQFSQPMVIPDVVGMDCARIVSVDPKFIAGFNLGLPTFRYVVTPKDTVSLLPSDKGITLGEITKRMGFDVEEPAPVLATILPHHGANEIIPPEPEPQPQAQIPPTKIVLRDVSPDLMVMLDAEMFIDRPKAARIVTEAFTSTLYLATLAVAGEFESQVRTPPHDGALGLLSTVASNLLVPMPQPEKIISFARDYINSHFGEPLQLDGYKAELLAEQIKDHFHAMLREMALHEMSPHALKFLSGIEAYQRNYHEPERDAFTLIAPSRAVLEVVKAAYDVTYCCEAVAPREDFDFHKDEPFFVPIEGADATYLISKRADFLSNPIVANSQLQRFVVGNHRNSNDPTGIETIVIPSLDEMTWASDQPPAAKRGRTVVSLTARRPSWALEAKLRMQNRVTVND